MARRIWWFTVSNAVDRWRRMRTHERDEALAVRSDSATARRTISVACAVLTDGDQSGCFVRGQLVKDGTFQSFRKE